MKAIYYCLFFAVFICFAGCPDLSVSEDAPKDRAYFPGSLLQTDKQLYVFSYNQDLRYSGGSILKLDLNTIGQDDQNAKIVSSFAPIPSFAEAPVLLGNSKILFLSRSTDEMLRFDISTNTSEKAQFDLTPDSAGLIRNWLWHDPYYLSILSNIGNEVTGLIGYLNDKSSLEKIEDFIGSRLENYGELEVFSLTDKLKINHTYRLQDIVPSPNPAANSSTTGESPYRRISHIGGIKILDKDDMPFVLIGADALPSSANLFSITRQSRLLWFSANNLEKEIDKKTIGEHILQPGKIVGFDVIKNKNLFQVYVIMEDPNLLMRVDLTKTTDGFTAQTNEQAPLCEKANDIRVAPKQKTLLVSCAQNSEILAFDTSDLMLVGRDMNIKDPASPQGRGPVHILFDGDSENQRAFVSYALDGSIGIFEVDDNKGKKRLNTVGRIFNQAPFNHPGGQ